MTSSSLAFSQTNDAIIYTLKGDIPPIRLSFSDLDKFLRDLQHLSNIGPENAGSETSCTYELAGPKSSISDPSINKIFGEDRLLTSANEFRLNCFNRRLLVSSINIALGRSSRWEIKGTDRVVLESVRSQLENFGQTYQTYLGGRWPQIIALLFLGFFPFVMLPTLIIKSIGPENRKKLENVIWGLFMLMGFLTGALIMSSGIPEYFFPTVAIYRGTASFLERYSAEISFWGIIFGIVVSLWIAKTPGRGKSEKVIPTDSPPLPPSNTQ